MDQGVKPPRPLSSPVRLRAHEGQQCGVAHILQEICKLPEVQGRVEGLPANLPSFVGQPSGGQHSQGKVREWRCLANDWEHGRPCQNKGHIAAMRGQRSTWPRL